MAKHQIPTGKDQLIMDRNHTRDRKKGIDAFKDTVANGFETRNGRMSTLINFGRNTKVYS